MLFGKEHVERYVATDGAEGYVWREGSKILILTTTGRSSGEPRQMPLIFGEHDGAYVLVASKGGAPDHPDWYKNLVANPRVQVQVLADRFEAVARTAHGAEREELWELMTGEWPHYPEYQQKTDREIPVVVLDRA